VNIESNIANRCLESCKKLLAGIEETKSGIAAEFRELVASNQKSFQLALNEAEALAWQTDYPQLFFPALAVEKIRAAAAWQTRQQTLQRPRLAFAQAV
jgi:predicted secreted hydrolase